jgi:hypothetical protein
MHHELKKMKKEGKTEEKKLDKDEKKMERKISVLFGGFYIFLSNEN